MTSAEQTNRSQQTLLAAAKGGSLLFVGQIIAYALRLALSLILARILGSEGYGLYGLSLSVMNLGLGIAMLGLGIGVLRFVAIRKNPDQIRGYLLACLGLAGGAGLLVTIILLLGRAPLVAYFEKPELYTLIPIAVIALPFGVFSNIFEKAGIGFRKPQVQFWASDLGRPAIKLLIILALFWVALDAADIVAIHTLSTIIAAGAAFFLLNRIFPIRGPAHFERKDLRVLLLFALPIYATELVALFSGQINTLVLGGWASAFAVGVFLVAGRVSALGKFFHSAVLQMTRPYIAIASQEKDTYQLRALYQTTTRWTIMLNLPLFLLLVVFAEPILLIFGEDFSTGKYALIILAISSMFGAATGLCGSFVNMSGQPKLNTYNSLIDVVVKLGLGLWLIPIWGVIGAAVASLAGTVIVNSLRLIQVYHIHRIQPYTLSLLKPLLAAVGALVVTYGFSQFVPVSDLFTLILNSLSLAAVYAILLFGLGLEDMDRKVLERAKGNLPWRKGVKK